MKGAGDAAKVSVLRIKERLEIRADICTMGAFEALIARLEAASLIEASARQTYEYELYNRTGHTITEHLRALRDKQVDDARQMQRDILYLFDRCRELELSQDLVVLQYNRLSDEAAQLRKLVFFNEAIKVKIGGLDAEQVATRESENR